MFQGGIWEGALAVGGPASAGTDQDPDDETQDEGGERDDEVACVGFGELVAGLGGVAGLEKDGTLCDRHCVPPSQIRDSKRAGGCFGVCVAPDGAGRICWVDSPR